MQEATVCTIVADGSARNTGTVSLNAKRSIVGAQKEQF
jgi:hypothetical protein